MNQKNLLNTIICPLLLTLANSVPSMAQTNVALTATSTHSGGGVSANGYGPELYNNNAIPTYLSGNTYEWGWLNSNGYIDYIWTSAQTIDSVTFHNGGAATNRHFTSLTLQYWNGSAYVNIGNITGTLTNTTGYKLTTPVTTTRIRFNNIAGNNPAFREIQTWENAQKDVGITQIISPAGVFCANQQAIQIAVRNYSTSSISNFPIQWSLNGVPQTAYTYTGTLQANNGPGQFIDTITIGTGTIVTGNNSIKVWTAISNDINKTNDTATKTVTPTLFTLSSLNDTICNATSTSLNLMPNAGYNPGILQWQESNDGLTFTNISNNPFFNYQTPNLTSDRYYRVLINSGTNGCYSSSAKVKVMDIPYVVNLGNDTAVCDKVTMKLDAGNTGAKYLWQDNSTDQTYNVNTPGTYYVKVSDSMGCFATDTINIIKEIYPNGYFDMNNWGGYNNPTYTFVAHLQNAVSFFWDFGDGSPTSTSNPVNHTYMNIGTYTAKLHILNDCGTEKILSKSTDIKVGTNEIELNNYIKIFPNPANHFVNIQTEDNLIIQEINIIDALGRTTIQEKPNNYHTKIDISQLAAGVYSMLIKTPKGTSIQKISIQ